MINPQYNGLAGYLAPITTPQYFGPGLSKAQTALGPGVSGTFNSRTAWFSWAINGTVANSAYQLNAPGNTTPAASPALRVICPFRWGLSRGLLNLTGPASGG